MKYHEMLDAILRSHNDELHKYMYVHLYKYSELSEKAQYRARDWYACTCSEEDAGMITEEDLASLRDTIESAGMILSDYCIGNMPGDHISIAPAFAKLDKLANFSDYYGWDAPFDINKCPRMTSDGYWLGEGVAEYWNKNCAPAIDKALAKVIGLYGDDLSDSGIESTILDQIDLLEDFALSDIQDDRGACFSDEYIVDMIEANELLFTEYGLPA